MSAASMAARASRVNPTERETINVPSLAPKMTT